MGIKFTCRFIVVCFIIGLLAGCEAGSSVFLSSTIQYQNDDSTVLVTRTATAKAKANTTNPPKAELPSISINPIMVPGDDTNVLSWQIKSEGVRGQGSFKSFEEAAMGLLRIPMWGGLAVILIGGGLLIFTPLKKTGLLTIMVGGGIIAAAYFLAAYSLVLLVISIVIALTVVGFMIWRLFIEDKTTKELVNTMETLKGDSDNELKMTIMEQELQQSKHTRNLVEDMKEQLGYK